MGKSAGELAAEIRSFAGSEVFKDETLAEMEAGVRVAWLPNTSAGVNKETPNKIAALLGIPVQKLLGGCGVCLWGVAPVFEKVVDTEAAKALIGKKKSKFAPPPPPPVKVAEAKCQYPPMDVEIPDFETNFCGNFASKG